MSARKPVLPKVAWWLSAFGEDDDLKREANTERLAAETVIRACRRAQRMVCKAGCDCICCRALARLDRVTRGSK